jgi:hypothetical protein
LKLELALCFCWNRSWNKKRRRILGGEQEEQEEQEEQVFEVVLFCVGSKFSLVPRKGFGSLVVLFATEIFFCVWFWRRRKKKKKKNYNNNNKGEVSWWWWGYIRLSSFCASLLFLRLCRSGHELLQIGSFGGLEGWSLFA